MTQLNTNSAIDWDLGIKLAGNKRAIAEEMIALLIKNLPHDLDQIKLAKAASNNKELLRLIHKLHGALCYCGTPRLKQATIHLETALKNQIENIDDLFFIFEKEVNAILS